jgi:methyl-accepting chemotaxis protein
MSVKAIPRPSAERRISLTLRVSVLLVFAVVIPLLITVVGSELILRPTLITQATTEMGNAAQSHQQTIDSLLIARQQDLGILDQFYAVQQFLSGNTIYKQQGLDELALGYHMDVNYSAWTLFDTRGQALLSYPAFPSLRGNYTIPPEIMAQVKSSRKTLISDVYFDDNTHTAFIDIYAAIESPGAKLLGIGRSTLNLNEIWTTVNDEANSVPGSYAIIVDEHGVRIGYTNIDTTLTTLPQGLFKAIGPLTSQFQQSIKDEDLYGNSHAAVTVLSDPVLVQQQQNVQETSTFQFVPALQNEVFQAYLVRCQVVPWSYIVLRPVNTITEAANRQDLYLFSLAAIITILAAILGLIIGRGITHPILGSVSSLIKSSEMLKTLAAREQAMAGEQKWIVESSQNGLKAVQYYAGASSLAAHKLGEIGQELKQNLERVDARKMEQRLNEIISTARYLEKAASHQEKSGESLSTAMSITSQVTDQLLSGATSASEAAAQLEEVITQLRHVVGE